MLKYMASFMVYTLAMIGILIIAYVVYKKASFQNPIRRNSSLKIIDVLRLPDRKTLYLIDCKSEQFLIASSNENVSLISKIDGKKLGREEKIKKYLEQQDNNTQFNDDNGQKRQVLKSLLKELSDKNQIKGDNL